MLKAYVKKLRQHCTDSIGNVLSDHTPPHAWAEEALRDFTVPIGLRSALHAAFVAHARRLSELIEPWLEGSDSGRLFAERLVAACAAIDDGTVWHRALRLRSYVDISIEVKAMRIFADYLAGRAAAVMPIQPIELTALVLEHFPDARAVLLTHAELLLEEGTVEAAIDSIQRALRVQAVCTTAQALLFRAYAAKREAGSARPEELAELEYDLSDKFCHLPFTHMSTFFEGKVYACSCPAWVPFPIGSIYEAGSGDAIWNSDVAAEIRASILDGSFRYCSRTQCSFIRARKLPKKTEVTDPLYRQYIEGNVTRVTQSPRMVELNHDPTCNLACPSCRTEIVAAKSDEQDLYARATDRVILPFLRRVEGHTYITGGGEAFASKHFRAILRALNRAEYPGLHVVLITNAQLITPYRWSEFPNLPEMLAILLVSIDAARAETYEKLRRPGKWPVLMRNLELIAGMRREGKIPRLGINFVVQKDNFREIPEFVALGQRLGADQVWLQRVVNYGAYDQATFEELDVTSTRHPDHPELLDILRQPILQHPSINMDMLLSLLPERVASDEPMRFLY
ncbi:MAG TPA: radical SAM protein [Thermoanaerobaculia bacterium]|nr:radical SAM protein [Thermoanaerobaculia bacterium]